MYAIMITVTDTDNIIKAGIPMACASGDSSTVVFEAISFPKMTKKIKSNI